MGIMIVCVSTLVLLVYFPQWGGMFCPASQSSEEDYYGSEWSADEQDKGLHSNSMKFAANARSERGKKGNSPNATSHPIDDKAANSLGKIHEAVV